jgi:hypothetical protein
MSLLPSSSFNPFIFSLFLLVLVLLGTRKQSNLQWSKMYVIRISRQPSPVQLKIDQKNCRMWNISPMWVINDARRTRQIKSRQTQHITRRRLFTSKLYLNLRTKLLKCYIWSVGRIVWCWNLDILESTSEITREFWNVVRVKNGDNQLDRSCKKLKSIIQEDRNILNKVNGSKTNWTGHILCRYCLLKHATEGKVEGRI